MDLDLTKLAAAFETAYEVADVEEVRLMAEAFSKVAATVQVAGSSIETVCDEWFAEIGARFSRTSIAAIELVISTLQELIQQDAVDKASSPDAVVGMQALEAVVRYEADCFSGVVQEAPPPGYVPHVYASKEEAIHSAKLAWSMYFKLHDFLKKHGLLDDAMRAQESWEPYINLMEHGEAPVEELQMVQKPRADFMETATLLAEADGSTAANPRFKMFVIREGMSHNRVHYGPQLLKEHGSKLNGKGMYVDHPSGGAGAGRSLTTKGGYWSDVTYEEGVETSGGRVNGLTGTLNLFSAAASPVPWLEGMIRESIAAGHPEAVGISIYASGKMKMARDAQGIYKEAITFENFVSADAVAEAGAGGEPISFAASKGIDPDVDDFTNLTAEEIKTARPDLVAALIAEAAPAAAAVTATPKPAAAPEFDLEAFAEQVANKMAAKATAAGEAPELVQFREATAMMQRQNTQRLLQDMLGDSKLPKAVREVIVAEIGDGIMEESAIKSVVDRYVGVAASVLGDEDSPTRMSSGMIIPFREAGRNPDLTGGGNPLDQVVWALEDFFGAGDDEHKGKFPKIWNFKEFYSQVTGDPEVTGFIDTKRSVLGNIWNSTFAEALPGSAHVVGGGTISMSGLINTTMNKALVKQYDAQPLWWEPIVDKQPLSDLKAQTRVRLFNFGSLTERTTDGAEYTELDWNSTSETYTPTEYGNVVTIGRRAIINDDLRGIQRIPSLLAQSAATTINEYVSALFTTNSGNGPVLADGIQVFNAASHQGNRLTLPLSRTNAISARYVIMKMLNDASKRIGLMPRTLLVPIDLEALAFELFSSTLVPDSANNAPNILSSPAGLRRVIVVPNWTDADNWYMMAEVSQVVGIEMGFLFGREAPEMFLQDNPTTGMVFTNDVITHKIRHDYGGDWLDYRAAVASIN